MAGPLMSAPVAAQQVAQQSLQDQASQQLKQGSSKFDGVMAEKVDRAKAASEVQAAAPTDRAAQVGHTSQVTKAEKADISSQVTKSAGVEKNGWLKSYLQPAQAQAPTAAGGVAGADGKMTDMAMKLMDNIEKGQGVMDKLIEAGLSGKQFSNSELIALQAGVFKYSQELELTGKVVDKATNGLKDTLKTQV